MDEFNIPIGAGPKEILEALDRWAANQPTGGTQFNKKVVGLAAILSALRGPDDDEESELKSKYTVPLRGFVLPTFCKRAGMSVEESPTLDFDFLGVWDSRIASSHYLRHIADAHFAINKHWFLK